MAQPIRLQLKSNRTLLMKYSSAGWLPWKLSYKRETQKDNITNYFVYKMEVSENDVTRTGVQRTGNV